MKMEITISTICPECKKEIRIYARAASEPIIQHYNVEKDLYESLAGKKKTEYWGIEYLMHLFKKKAVDKKIQKMILEAIKSSNNNKNLISSDINIHDISKIIEKSRKIFMIEAGASGRYRIKKLVEKIRPRNLRKARGAIISVLGGKNTTLDETNYIIEYITNKIDGNADIIWSFRINTKLKDRIKLYLLFSE